MKVCDLRIRPATQEFSSYMRNPDGTPGYIFTKTGHPVPEITSMEAFLADVKDAGITKFVCTGRAPIVSDDYIASLADKYSDQIIGVGGCNPAEGEAALKHVEHCIKDLGLHGISMDTFFYDKYPNDPLFYPVYDLCQSLNVPVFLTMGPLPIGMGKFRYANPVYVDDIAQDFPKLRVVISHGGFPYTQEIMSVAWRNQNIYFETSIYRTKPGTEMLIKAGNEGWLADKMLYASAFPFAPYRQSLEEFFTLGYKDEVAEKILWKNAEAFFGFSL